MVMGSLVLVKDEMCLDGVYGCFLKLDMCIVLIIEFWIKVEIFIFDVKIFDIIDYFVYDDKFLMVLVI